MSADHTQEHEWVELLRGEARRDEFPETFDEDGIAVRSEILRQGADALDRTLDRLEAAKRDRDEMQGWKDTAESLEADYREQVARLTTALAALVRRVKELDGRAHDFGRLNEVAHAEDVLAASPGEPDTQEPPEVPCSHSRPHEAHTWTNRYRALHCPGLPAEEPQ